MRFFKRQPDAEVTVAAGTPRDAAHAMLMHRNFCNLALHHKVNVVKTEGKYLTLRGRPKNIKAFSEAHDALSQMQVL